MVSSLSNRAQFVVSFLASLVITYVIYRRDGDKERIEPQMYSQVGAVIGLFAGVKLAQRADEQQSS